MRVTVLKSGLILSLLLTCSPDATRASVDGDTFSFHHQTGAMIDGMFQCFSEHMSGMDDNTAVFDGITESLDTYSDGNQPVIYESVTSRRAHQRGGTQTTVELVTMGTSDLFPEGFEDPETGTPLTDACVEIGIDDTLDPDPPMIVTSASLTFTRNDTPFLDLTIPDHFFSTPWDGRLSLVLQDFAGLDIDGVQLMMDMQPDPMSIFADGFESGNTSSWTSEVP